MKKNTKQKTKDREAFKKLCAEPENKALIDDIKKEYLKVAKESFDKKDLGKECWNIEYGPTYVVRDEEGLNQQFEEMEKHLSKTNKNKK